MTDKLIVKDFGPIRHAEMDIKKTTVLIGPQGSGKSTLAKLVAIMKDSGIFPDFQSNDKYLFQKYGIQDYVQKNSKLNFKTSGFNLVYSSDGFNITLSESAQSHANELIEYNRIQGASSFEGYKQMLERRNKSQSFDFSPSFSIARRFYSQYFQDMIFKPIPAYFPSERQIISILSNSLWSIINSGTNLPKSITALGENFERARNELKKIQIPFLNITYSHEGNSDKIFFDDEKFIMLPESATGFQTIVPLLITLNYLAPYDSTNFIIEEPELNLYPSTQKSLIYYIHSQRGHFQNKIFITTHSPYVLAALNNLLFAYQVAREKPELASEVEKVIPQDSWLNPNDFAAYFVADGTVRSIINPKTGLISENELDSVSDEIGDEFDNLMDLYRRKKE